MPLNLWDSLLTSFQTIIKSLTPKHPKCSPHFCGCRSSSSHVLVTMLPLDTLLPSSCFCFRNPHSPLGFPKKRGARGSQTLLMGRWQENHKARGPQCGSAFQTFIPLIYKCNFLVPWIWQWGSHAVKGICVLKLRDGVGCIEIIKQQIIVSKYLSTVLRNWPYRDLYQYLLWDSQQSK